MGRLKMMILCTMILLFSNSLSVHAETNGRVFIEANYSSNITPQSGDEFELVYMLQGGTDTATITLDASNYAENTGVFELPEAYYEITSITYTGSNPAIPSEGYGVRRDFVSSQDGGSYIYISIGRSANIALQQNYDGALFVDPTNAINEQEAVTRDELAANESNTDENNTENAYNGGYESDTETSGPINRSTDEVEVEHYAEEDEDGNSSRLSSIIIKLSGVGILLLLGLGVIFLLYKKKKISKNGI